MRRTLSRRTSLASVLVIGLQMWTREDARADIFGGDDILLTDILTQTYQEVSALWKQLDALKQQVDDTERMLSRLDPHSFDAVVDLVNSSRDAYAAITRDIDTMGYTLDAVQRDFPKKFPKDWTKSRYADFAATTDRWEKDILGASEVAARAQSVVANLHQHAERTADILKQSANADGPVQQLQSVVQLLSVMQSQGNDLIQSLASAERTTSLLAAQSAAERQLSRERRRRDMKNYTDKGPPVPVLTKLP